MDALQTILTLGSIVGDQVDSIVGNASDLSNNATGDCLKLVPQDATLSFLELAQKYGHPAEHHKVVTEDGYILTVYRMRGKRKALPILLMHGLMDSSDTWIERGNTSLSITLVKYGYDVWLGNGRGNPYSRGHVSIDMESNPAAYWNFTFHEHGKYDLPAIIDLVLNKTDAKKLNAYGHSQGNTIFYVLCSTRPEYNEKINVLTALAPIAYLHHIPPPLSTLIESSPIIYTIASALKVHEMFPENSIVIQGLRFLCPLPILGYNVCALGLIFPLTGFDPSELEPYFLRVLIRHYPVSTSLKNLYHFSQVALKKKFCHFDYGEVGNKIAYNSSAPPDYDLSKITARVVLLAGENDRVSTLKDVEILRKQLPNVVSYRIIPRPQCNHVDFVTGKNMASYVYPDILKVLRVYGDN